MEYVEEESRPRFLFQSRPSAAAAAAAAADTAPETLIKVSRLHAAACFSSAAVLLLLSFLSLSRDYQIVSSLLIWISLSLLAGPFAPPSITGGDPVVGRGDPLPPSISPTPSDPDESKKQRRPRSRPSDPPPPVVAATVAKTPVANQETKRGEEEEEEEEEEKDWTDEDFDLLKKQIGKHPVGAPRRWERIAEAFRGRHGLDSVIRTAKALPERRPGDGDSYAQFLRQRKPIDRRAEAAEGESNVADVQESGSSKSGGWSSAEDIALLNALKAFPKDTSMRWEKVAAAIPGKSKACCVKRVAELKKGLRSSKGSEA